MLRYWEILLITRGYRRRNALQYQLQRAQAYAANFCMGNPKKVRVEEFLPLYVDRYIDTSQYSEVSQEEVAEMQAEMNEYNNSIFSDNEGRQ